MPAEPQQKPLVLAVDMGYGHLRAATSLASALATEVTRLDQAPLASRAEEWLWRLSRWSYESTSRLSQLPWVGGLGRYGLNQVTHIPQLHPARDLSKPTLTVRLLEHAMEWGLGAGLMSEVAHNGTPVLATFFAPALAADRSRHARVYCVVTDSDISRAWVPSEPGRSSIRYLVPSHRARRRLRAYGVAAEKIQFTGFPLPPELVGGPELIVLRRNLAARLSRLDPRRTFRTAHRQSLARSLEESQERASSGPPLITFVVGGAGAQAEMARPLLQGLRPALARGRIRLCLAAGTKPAVAGRFERWARAAGLDPASGTAVEILFEEKVETYFKRFNERLAETDLLWTKPSEMTFYGALGIPLILGPPVGIHERYNRRWALENGACLEPRNLHCAGDWITEWLNDGTLAAAAWTGFVRLPKLGLYRILEEVGLPQSPPA